MPGKNPKGYDGLIPRWGNAVCGLRGTQAATALQVHSQIGTASHYYGGVSFAIVSFAIGSALFDTLVRLTFKRQSRQA